MRLFVVAGIDVYTRMEPPLSTAPSPHDLRTQIAFPSVKQFTNGCCFCLHHLVVPHTQKPTVHQVYECVMV